MTSPSLALQTALRARLIAVSGVTTLVPATSILDRLARPETFPCIVLGDDQEVDDPSPLARNRVDVYATLHIWARESGLAGVKAITGAVRVAVQIEPHAWTMTGWRVVDLMPQSARFLRDPDGITAHGLLNIEAILEAT